LYGGRGNGLIPSGTGRQAFVDRFISFYGNMAYLYDKRYNFSVSARKDASNLFGVDINNKWKPLWSVGGAWTISNEPFYKIKAIEYLKLRGTLGYQGNVNNSLPTYAIMARYFSELTNESIVDIVQPGDPSLRWETTRQINLGLDFGTLKGRINGSVEYYNKKSSDVISRAVSDLTTGVESVFKNSADLLGKGLELSLNTTNINRKFKWTTELLFSYQTYKVTNY
jgi:hypothetical protein